MRDIYDIIQELREFLATLAEGELSTELKTKGYVAGLLKTLQANLRHVTWQTQRIAEGDYSHNVEFLGEFSAAFNQMKNQLAEVTQALKKQAETDGLTGLLNHSAIIERIKTEAERNKRYGNPFAIIMLDIDHFKQVNDQYGHLAGDLVIQGVAGIIADSLRSLDFAGRYGGEEYVLVLTNCGKSSASLVAERIRHLVEQHSNFPEEIRITLSGGVAEYAGQSSEQLVRKADELLYVAKKQGRNRIESDAAPV